MLLHQKGWPIRALCHSCKHLHEPTAWALATAAKKRGTMFLCDPCYRRLLVESKRFERRMAAV